MNLHSAPLRAAGLRGGVEIGRIVAGATLVAGDFDVDLVPFDVQFINTAFSDNGAVATQTPFDLFYWAATSANGIAATRVDPGDGPLHHHDSRSRLTT